MSILVRSLACFTFAPLVALPCSAQQTRYRLASGDTVRYREITESRIELRPPQGPVTITAHHDATIALVSERGDTATAWYEQLTLLSVYPDHESRPGTAAALHQPFRLLFSPLGRVSLLSAPTFDKEISDQTDLTREFEDIFISVTSAKLRPNLAWSDTLEDSRATKPANTYHSRHIRRFRVLRDTVAAGNAPAVVIAVEQEVDFRTSGPLENQPVTVTTHIQGREAGTAIFATRAGRLLTRERHGRLEGTQLLEGQARQLEVPMVYEYTSRLALTP